MQALEALRKLRTEKAQEVKELKLKLEHTKTLKDQAAVGAASFAPAMEGCYVCQAARRQQPTPCTSFLSAVDDARQMLLCICSSEPTRCLDPCTLPPALPQKLRGEEKQGRARLRELQEQIGRLDRDSEVSTAQRSVA